MTEYQRQLKDPRWQKRRLDIMNRDKWTCKNCDDSESTLTVHHKSYRMTDGKFADIWDYADDDLITLCEACHEEEEADLANHQKFFYFQVRNYLESSKEFNHVLGILKVASERAGDRRLDKIDLMEISGIIQEGILWGK